MSRRLTIGMRCRFISKKTEDHSWAEYADRECLLKERSSGGDFSVMVLGQEELKKEDPKTVLNEVAWVSEDDLEFVNAKFKANLDFMDWYEEHEEDFCGDCLAWFPDRGRLDPETDEDHVCPNEKCPGRLYDSGVCPSCERPSKDGETECPKCGFEWDLHW